VLGLHGQVHLVAAERGPVPTETGARIEATVAFHEAPDRFDVLFGPGRLATNRAMTDVVHLRISTAPRAGPTAAPQGRAQCGPRHAVCTGDGARPHWPRLKEITMGGTADKAKGRVKEAAGALSGDRKLKSEGKLDQATGAVKDAVDKVADKAKRALRGSKSK
jgi:uncharacterized protein YjbJ (UPF0337 family)